MPRGAEEIATRAAPPATVTVAVALAVPLPLAASVYVVVADGVTVTEPLTGCEPTPLSMVTDVALEVLHDNVDACPALMLDGFAVNEVMTGAGDGVVEVRVTENVNDSPNWSVSGPPLIVVPLTVAETVSPKKNVIVFPLT